MSEPDHVLEAERHWKPTKAAWNGGICDECGEPLTDVAPAWYHRECDLKRDEAKQEELRSLKEERDALSAQLRGVGIVPYLDRMKELAEARDEALALMKRDQPDMYRALLADQEKQDELRRQAESAEVEVKRLRDGLTRTAAELRHAYRQLAAGEVVNQRKFAQGLLAPQIGRLERLAQESK